MNKHKESDIYHAVSKFLRIKYPDLIWRFDFGAGLKMSMYQAKIHKGLNPHRGYPDLFICRPSNGYAGLYIEIKKEGEKIVRKDGELYADNHLHEQRDILERLKREGYYATFAVGFNETIETIENYLR